MSKTRKKITGQFLRRLAKSYIKLNDGKQINELIPFDGWFKEITSTMPATDLDGLKTSIEFFVAKSNIAIPITADSNAYISQSQFFKYPTATPEQMLKLGGLLYMLMTCPKTAAITTIDKFKFHKFITPHFTYGSLTISAGLMMPIVCFPDHLPLQIADDIIIKSCEFLGIKPNDTVLISKPKIYWNID